MAQLSDFLKIIHNGNEMGKVLHQGKTIWQKEPDVYLAQDSDFVDVIGYWVYRGEALEVEIPTHINGQLVTTTQRMFSGSSGYDATPVTKVVLNHSNVTDMRSMFASSNATILDLSNFDTSNVTSMAYMFMNSQATTLDLSGFDTSKVTTTSSMFRSTSATIGYARTQADADKFNAVSNKPTGLNFVSPYLAQDSDFVKVGINWVYRGTELEIEIPTHINGQLVTTTQNMFNGDPYYGATPVTKVVLNHSKVTNMSYMFQGSSATTLDLSNFNTSNVVYMSYMFYNSLATTLDLSSLDTSKVTSMSGMFQDAKATTLDLSNFNTSNVTNMSSMFNMYKATTLDLSNFNTSKVTNMSYMFNGSQATTLDLSSFDTSNVINMDSMFSNSQATTLDLSNFNTSNVTNMSSMFTWSKATTLDLSSFNTSNVTNMSTMFRNASTTTGYARTQADADKFNASSSKPTGLNFVVKP